MKTTYSIAAKAAVAALLLGAAFTEARASAVIVNSAGTVALGVLDWGNLGFNGGGGLSTTNGAGGDVGVAVKNTAGTGFVDSTAPGCVCEGWGVSANGTAAGYSDTDAGGNGVNLTVVSFTSTASTATSTVKVTSLPALQVSQAYAPVAGVDGNILFQDVVTISNLGATTLTDVSYVRAMDWDIPPTEFNEFVTIKGTATTTALVTSGDNGFDVPNPLSPHPTLFVGTPKIDFTDNGPSDHGAYFDFDFGSILAGASYTFSIYYGGGYSETSVLGALGDVGIELYSLGQSSTADGPTLGTPYTFAFGFKGVGGVTVLPPGPDAPPAPVGAVPEPSTYGLMGAATLGMIVAIRRRRAKSA